MDMGVMAEAERGRAWLCYDPHVDEHCGAVNWRDHITVEPDKLGGKATVRGMRIGVVHVLEYLASGMSVEQLLEDFPDLTRDDVLACLAFAAEREHTAVRPTP